MSRVIKFRAWDKTNNRMMIFDDFWPCDEYRSLAWRINEKSMTKNDGNYRLDWDEEALELMQFTGLTDKNGKEIYDGDWLKDSLGRLHKMVWSDTEARFQLRFFEVDWQIRHIVDARTMEVIGNIYENPELLNEKH